MRVLTTTRIATTAPAVARTVHRLALGQRWTMARTSASIRMASTTASANGHISALKA